MSTDVKTPMRKVVAIIGFIVGFLCLVWFAVELLFIVVAVRGGISWAVPIGFFLLTAGLVLGIAVLVWWLRHRREEGGEAEPYYEAAAKVLTEEQPTFQLSWDWGWFKSKWPVFVALGIYVILWLVLRLVYGVIEWTAGNWGWDVNILSRFLFSVEIGVPFAVVFFAIRLMNMLVVASGEYSEVPWGEIVGFLWLKTMLVFVGFCALTFITGWQVELFALLAAWAVGLAMWYVEANRAKGAE